MNKHLSALLLSIVSLFAIVSGQYWVFAFLATLVIFVIFN